MGDTKYDIHDANGRRMFIGVYDDGTCYSWRTGYGFIDKLTIQREGWQVRVAAQQKVA